jgi:cytochrome P450
MDIILESPDYSKVPALKDMILIEDYEECAEILRSKQFVQSGYRINKETLMKNVLITLDGEPHMKRRRALAKIFDDNKIAYLRDQYLIPVTKHSIDEIRKLPREKDGSVKVDLVPFIQRCLFRIGAAVAGVDGVESPEAADRLIRQVIAISDGLVADWAREDREGIVRKGEEAREQFRREFYNPSYARRKKLIEEAKAKGDLSGLPQDGLTLMMTNTDGSWEGDEDLLLRETYVFMVASTQTTANGLTWFIIRLENWLKNHPEDRKLIESDPEFLRRAAYDSLRLTITAPWRARTATEDLTLASGRKIAKGQDVALFFIPANTQEDHYGPDAKDFNPHRKAEGQVPWGHAFGGGVHMCVGRPLVTGSRSLQGTTTADGTLVSTTRLFYEAGLEMDPDGKPTLDSGTWFTIYSSVPVRFTKL